MRDPEQAAEGTFAWKSLGAEVDGGLGTVEAQREFRRALCGSNVDLVLKEFDLAPNATDFLSPLSKNVHSLQYALPLSCLLQKSFIAVHDAKAVCLGAEVGDESLSLTCSLPMQV